MLNDLSWLDEGQKFPPKCEHERLEMYSKNRELFESEHAEVYKEDLKRIERVIGNFKDVVSYPIILNFQKLMTLKIADLLLGEPPIITCGDDDSAEQETVKEIQKSSDFLNTAYKVAIDISRYGDGLFHIILKDGKGKISHTQPPVWFPVVDEEDMTEILYHVLAWENTAGNKLNVRIHSKGSYEKREYKLDRGMIMGMASEPEVIQTGLTGFAIVQVPNVITTDRVTGMDDYTDIDSIISDLIVRLGQIDRILDKHANPSMSGSQAALEQDPISGEWRLKVGGYYVRESNDDSDIKYITWDGQLSANFTQIDKLVNLLYTLSEMGSSLFGDTSNSTGQVPSGSALKRLMISPLAKVNRIRMRFDPAIKEALTLCSEYGGTGILNLRGEEVSINWFDGLPADPTEDAAIIASRTGGKATMSQQRALTIYDGLSKAKAEEELERIMDEEAAGAPTPTPFGNANTNQTEPGEDDEIKAPAAVKQSLNGAQMRSLMDVVGAVKDGEMSRTAGINLIVSSLPLEQAQAEAIIEANF